MPSYCHSFCLPPVWRGSGENPHHPNENEFGRAAVCVCGSRAKIDSVRGGDVSLAASKMASCRAKKERERPSSYI